MLYCPGVLQHCIAPMYPGGNTPTCADAMGIAEKSSIMSASKKRFMSVLLQGNNGVSATVGFVNHSDIALCLGDCGILVKRYINALDVAGTIWSA